MHKTFTGVFLLIAMAVVGLGLIWLPGWVIDNYQAAAGVGSIWGVLYLIIVGIGTLLVLCLLYTSPSPRDQRGSRMPSSA